MSIVDDIRILFPTYSRQFAHPERIPVKSFEELMSYVDKYNGMTRCYATIYNFTGNGGVMVDKVCFDFDSMDEIDGEYKCFIDIKNLHEYLKEQDIMHTMVFSGKGFHCYIFTENYSTLKNPKNALKNAQECLQAQLNLMCDKAIVGDVARIFGIPGTLNIRRQRFVIFINDDDLLHGYEFIRERARKQQSEMVIYGAKKLDISQYDTEQKHITVEEMGTNKYDEKLEDEVLKNAPPCIIRALKEDGDWRCRWLVALYLKESGFPESVTEQICMKYFSKFQRTDRHKNNWRQMQAVKTIHYTYQRDDMYPNCETVFELGKCCGKCPFYNLPDKMYKKVR